jgi:hypothetical protein
MATSTLTVNNVFPETCRECLATVAANDQFGRISARHAVLSGDRHVSATQSFPLDVEPETIRAWFASHHS